MVTIQILGPGCPKCRKLAENAGEAARLLGLACQVEKITDITEIMNLGVMMTPGLAVNGEVKVTGKLLSVEEIKGILSGSAP